MNTFTVFPTFILGLLFLAGMLGAFGIGFTYNTTNTLVNGIAIDNLTMPQAIQYSLSNSTDPLTFATYYVLPNGSTMTVNAFGGEVGINNGNYHKTGASFLGFAFDSTSGFMLVLGAVMGIAGLVGITIFGSGLGDYSESVLIKGAIYGGIWIFLSSFSTSLLGTIPLNLGLYVIYLPLSIMFFLGFLQAMQHNDVE
jgi:hypothetical protein